MWLSQDARSRLTDNQNRIVLWAVGDEGRMHSQHPESSSTTAVQRRIPGTSLAASWRCSGTLRGDRGLHRQMAHTKPERQGALSQRIGQGSKAERLRSCPLPPKTAPIPPRPSPPRPPHLLKVHKLKTENPVWLGVSMSLRAHGAFIAGVQATASEHTNCHDCGCIPEHNRARWHFLQEKADGPSLCVTNQAHCCVCSYTMRRPGSEHQ